MSLALARILALALAVALGGCGSSSGTTHGGGGSGGNGGGGSGGGGSSGCVGLQCQQMSCPGGGTTSLTGKVFAPNGTLPLYNAIVYVPNSQPAAFTDGVTCDRCNGSVSGDPVTITQTDATGSFTLTNVPVGKNIPLVIQLGKWRRQATIASVPSCVSTPLDAGSTRLPQNRTEGDLPKMAIVTGSVDPFECGVLLKMGIDPSEIAEPTNTAARIHMYKGHNNPGTTISSSTPDGINLYSNLNELLKYDVLMLPCEGNAYDQSAGTANVAKYVNMGGRVFTTHFSYDWWTYPGSDFNRIAPTNTQVNGLWPLGQKDYFKYAIASTIDQTFPKGKALAQWLVAAGAKSASGFLDIDQGRHDLTSVDSNLAQAWTSYDFNSPPMGATNVNGGPGVMHITFNTPLDAPPDDMGVKQYCGRAVFSDFHVAQSEADKSKPFPMACTAGDLTDQEKALIFMLFDLSSCVQSDQTNPIP